MGKLAEYLRWTLPTIPYIKKEGAAVEKAVEIDLDQYRRQLRKAYWLPHFCKWIAWFLAITTISTCAVVLVLYGMTFGEVKSKFWLTSVFASEGIQTFVVHPVKALLLAFIASYVLKLEYRVFHKPLSPAILKNPVDDRKLEQVEDYREKMASFYNTPSEEALKKRKVQLCSIRDLEIYLFDLIWYVIFMVVLCWLVIVHRSDRIYAGHANTVKLLISAEYSQTIPLTRVLSYEQFIEYVNITLLPVLMWEGFIGKHVNILDRGQTIEPHLKLIGKPRLRQRRVKQEICSFPRRNHVCAGELGWWNEDRSDYRLSWLLHSESDPQTKGFERDPWVYRSERENPDLSVHIGLLNFFTFGSGGYVLDLDKTLQNSRIILKSMDYFNWIDSRTREIYIDFTLYNADANLFHVVTILVEVSASGVFIPSYQIYSDNFLFIELSTLVVISLGMFFFFVIVFVSLIFECMRMRAATLKAYFTEGWSVLDLMICVMATVSFLSYVSMAILVNLVLADIKKASTSGYVGFQIPAFLSELVDNLNGLTIFLATLKFCRFLTINTLWYEWERGLRKVLPSFRSLYLILLYTTVGFSFYLFLTLGRCEERFNNVLTSTTFLLANANLRDDYFDENCLYMAVTPLASILYVVYVLLTNFIIYALAFAIAFYLRCVHVLPARSNYKIRIYLKSLIDPKLEMPGPPDVIKPPPFIRKKGFRARNDEIRSQGLKRLTLEMLTGEDYFEEAAKNIVNLVLYYYQRFEITDSRMIGMENVVNNVLRNNTNKNNS